MIQQKIGLLCFFLTFYCLPIHAQPSCFFEHYSTKDGLSQQMVMDILQDRKGFLWLATWNGICKFDGYSFTSYPPFSNIRNSRIDHIYEDKYGFIWMLSYDGEVHRFDPSTETIVSLQYSILNSGERNVFAPISKIITMPSGKIWLLSDKNGCICVTDSVLSIEYYHAENERIKGEKIFSIHEDAQLNSWILSDNGLYLLPYPEKEPVMLFTEINTNNKLFNQSFFSSLELDDELWFGSVAGRIWRYSKKDGQLSLLEMPVVSSIIEMKRLGDDKIVIASSENGFCIYYLQSGRTEYYHSSNSELINNKIHSLYVDHSQHVWIETDSRGISKYSPETRCIKHFQVNIEAPNENFHQSSFLIEDPSRRVWVYPRGGGFSLYDPQEDCLKPFFNESESPDWQFSNILHTAYIDRQGNLWLSPRSGCLEKVIFTDNFFKTARIDNDSDAHSVINNNVRAIFEDHDNNCWISVKSGMIRIYDENKCFLGYLCHDGKIGNRKPLTGITYCIIQDDSGNIWLGTKGNGLYRLEKNKTDYHITKYRNDPDDIYSLSDNNIFAIYQDTNRKIWVGTYGGGLNLLEFTDSGSVRFIHHRNQLKNYPVHVASQIRCINEDGNGKICVGTTIGLVMFDAEFSRPENISYRYYSHTVGDDKSISNNNIYSICNTIDGNMYLATFGGGINKVTERDNSGFPTGFKSYKQENGLPSDVVLSIVEAPNKSLWIATESDLTKFSPEQETFETFSEINRLIGDNIFSEGATILSRSGTMMSGYSNGILSFFPQDITNNTYSPYIALNRFRLFNKDVPIGDDSPLHLHIDDMNKLVLNHRQNYFSIEYAALDYNASDNILYAYLLKGFDNDWQYVQRQRIANYTNLPKGQYVFCVKSTNSDGVWTENNRELTIEILPSFWETNWAYALYVAVFFLITACCVGVMNIIYRLKHKVVVETHFSEMKLRFFTDISHEIRTPLTLISSPVDYLLSDQETPPKIRSQLSYVAKNVNRMLRMVNQILDLRKSQQHRLQIEEFAVMPFVEMICENFKSVSMEQGIDFRKNNDAPGIKIWADHDSFEKILFNLLSNAFKYTPCNKIIEVNITEEEAFVCVEVKDQGKGITSEKQKKMFTRFETFNDDKRQPSTGIGLSIVKNLADRHHALIDVSSAPGCGSSFTVRFRKGNKHFGNDVDIKLFDAIPENESEVNQPYGTEPVEQPAVSGISVLLVEDDSDLRSFLKNILKTTYRVLEAENGKDGMEIAKHHIPDLIISDIMMPEMTGIELLQQIKICNNTSHIPMVLLTARTAIESKLESLEYGADDYITKPFSVPYFLARLQNLLKQREKIHQLYTSNMLGHVFAPAIPQITSRDKEFMDKILRDIEINMDNCDYTVENLVIVTGMSRSVFFKKIKSLTGFAPVEFIRDIKMQRAAQLINLNQFSIKQITYMIGINDVKYFAKCFKKKFGMNPSEYKKQNISFNPAASS